MDEIRCPGCGNYVLDPLDCDCPPMNGEPLTGWQWVAISILFLGPVVLLFWVCK